MVVNPKVKRTPLLVCVLECVVRLIVGPALHVETAV